MVARVGRRKTSISMLMLPKGRKTEKGPLPEIYQLQEMPTDSYEARTQQNVLDSDGTLIVVRGKLSFSSGDRQQRIEE